MSKWDQMSDRERQSWRARDAILYYLYRKKKDHLSGPNHPEQGLPDHKGIREVVDWDDSSDIHLGLWVALEMEYLIEMGYVSYWTPKGGLEPGVPIYKITAKGENTVVGGRSVLDPQGSSVYVFNNATGNFQIENNYSVENNLGNLQQGDGGRQYN
jgi:hypothetical protein